jgi:hypothetical protein
MSDYRVHVVYDGPLEIIRVRLPATAQVGDLVVLDEWFANSGAFAQYDEFRWVNTGGLWEKTRPKRYMYAIKDEHSLTFVQELK